MSAITLLSKEGEKFQVSSEIKNMSELINNIMEDNADEALEEEIPLNITSKFLKVIIDYCTHYKFNKTKTDIIAPLVSKVPKEFIKDPWEVQFIMQFTEDELIDLI